MTCRRSGKVQPHIFCRPGDVAKYVLLPGDPKRVERMAGHLDEGRKVAEYRQYVTYTGAHHGIPVSVTSTGIGCPAASIAVEELARVGAGVLIRVGTTGGLQEDVDLGDIVIATAAIRADGATRAYAPPEFPAVADLRVTGALIRAAEELKASFHVGVVWTSDAFYAEDPEAVRTWSRLGAISVEMESSAIFLLSHLRGLRAGAILAVDGNLIKGTKKGAFRPGEEKGELEPRVQRAIDLETEIALRAIEILEKG